MCIRKAGKKPVRELSSSIALGLSPVDGLGLMVGLSLDEMHSAFEGRGSLWNFRVLSSGLSLVDGLGLRETFRLMRCMTHSKGGLTLDEMQCAFEEHPEVA